MKYSSDYLSGDEKVRFYAAILKVLKKGICFNSGEAVAVFKKHGAKTDGNLVSIDEKILMSSLKSAPRSFTVSGRGSEFKVGGDFPALAPASGPVFVKTGKKGICALRKTI